VHQEHKSLSEFDLHEIGAVADAATFIEAQWRRETRPKRMRANSTAEEVVKQRKIERRIHMLEAASFDTSSHNTIDYLVETRSAKSFNFGQDGRYPHLKRQRPVRRSVSAGDFNWNLLVAHVDKRFKKEAELQAKLTSALPLSKLTKVLGSDLLAKIRDELPELHQHLMEHIKLKKKLSYAFCKELLAQYNLNLDEEKKLLLLKHEN